MAMPVATDSASVSSTAAASSSTGAAKKAKVTSRMIWDNEKDLILLGEVILSRPYQFRKGTNERGKAWQEVADALKARNFKVDRRAVRDRVNTLIDRVKDKNRRERAASGIAVEETDEEKNIREIVEDLIQEEEDIEAAPRERGDEERKKADGAEMRKRACETFGETNKRHQGDNVPSKRSRNNGSETVALLNRKIELDHQIKQEETAQRREQEERRRSDEMERERRFDLVQQQMLQQQQMFQQQQQQLQQQLLQQQQAAQQQTQHIQAMMVAFMKSLEKN